METRYAGLIRFQTPLARAFVRNLRVGHQLVFASRPRARFDHFLAVSFAYWLIARNTTGHGSRSPNERRRAVVVLDLRCRSHLPLPLLRVGVSAHLANLHVAGMLQPFLRLGSREVRRLLGLAELVVVYFALIGRLLQVRICETGIVLVTLLLASDDEIEDQLVSPVDSSDVALSSLIGHSKLLGVPSP